MNKHYVTIAGQGFSLVSDEEEDYIREIARTINEIIQKFNSKRATQSVATEARLIYASIQLADELFKERRESAQLAELLRQSKAAPEALAVAEKRLEAFEAEVKMLKETCEALTHERDEAKRGWDEAEAENERDKAERDMLKMGGARRKQNPKQRNNPNRT